MVAPFQPHTFAAAAAADDDATAAAITAQAAFASPERRGTTQGLEPPPTLGGGAPPMTASPASLGPKSLETGTDSSIEPPASFSLATLGTSRAPGSVSGAAPAASLTPPTSTASPSTSRSSSVLRTPVGASTSSGSASASNSLPAAAHPSPVAAASTTPRSSIGPLMGSTMFPGSASVRKGNLRSTCSVSSAGKERSRTASNASTDRDLSSAKSETGSHGAAASRAGSLHALSVTSSPDVRGWDDSAHESFDTARAPPPDHMDSWQDVPRHDVTTPPGAIAHLPSNPLVGAVVEAPADAPGHTRSVSRESAGPLLDRQGAHSSTAAAPPRDFWAPDASRGDYDWASFAWAYARGRWDPNRLPHPPGLSTACPGSSTRIGVLGQLPSSGPPGDGGRRPSLAYSPPAEGLAPVDLAGPPPSGPISACADWVEPATPHGRAQASGMERRPDWPSAVFSTASQQDAVAGTLSNQASGEPAQQTVADATTAVGPGGADPLRMLQIASSSAPEVGTAVSLGDQALKMLSVDTARERRPSSHSLPVARHAAVGLERQRPMYDGSVWHSGLHDGNARPSGESLGEGPSNKNASSSSVDSGDAATTRPGPTPLQLPDLNDLDALPDTWASAPEGSLTSYNSVLLQGGGTNVAAEGAASDDCTTVAGLRRAARRASARRTQGSDRGRDGVLHSQSFPMVSSKSAEVSPLGGDDGTGANGSALVTDEDESPRRVPDKTHSADEVEWKGSMRRPSHAEESSRPSPFVAARASTVCEVPSPPAGDSQHAGTGIPPRPVPAPNPTASAFASVGRRVEMFYREHGYLPSISPPDEQERRQALRRYGSPRVQSDANFERVAHLVKLVFNTKLVLISLISDSTQYFHTQAGSTGGISREWLQQLASPRDCSFCAHAILQASDEPLVVLDATKDWRFAGNPLVMGEPKIRFYAGSSLRTSDGYNLGSLCIIDDRPWPEFSPRQRHTLREFARVVMREMELVRDAIHLRIRDRMQHSIETFTRECLEMESTESHDRETEDGGTGGLHRVYEYAAKGMKEALQASGAVIFDLSHFELIESPAHEEGGSKIFFPSPYQNPEITPYASFDNPSALEAVHSPSMHHEVDHPSLQEKSVPPMAVLGACESLPAPADRDRPVPLSHYVKVAEFLRKHRTGCYYPFTPAPFRHLLPPGMSSLLMVPIFGLNKQPFALLCAYSRVSSSGPTLEDIKDSGLQYLRAMGTIILSAILKKDIMLADKAKSHFISNISHELRTPLHGILAAAELLSETKLNATQGSYLETVEACGKSLLELVNHVLDFTKLSGNMRSSQPLSKPSQRCDMVRLLQEVCESSSIGQMARKLESQQNSGIGSAYAQGALIDPGFSGAGSAAASERSGADVVSQAQPSSAFRQMGPPVETVIDVSLRREGWLVKCDAAGIRRVLMNLIGNSLKFTSHGFVHVSLREVQSSDTHVVVELGVTDTGKGISRTFLEEQLFHPFTQENHLGPGTGLGLSIVNSIVQSPAINGKIDVWSTLGQGTEIRVTCELELAHATEAEGTIYRPALEVEQKYTVSMLGFADERGPQDLREVYRVYFEDWWQFVVVDAEAERRGVLGDIVLVNEDISQLTRVERLVRAAGPDAPLPPVIVLTSLRGSTDVTNVCNAYHDAGGVARLLFKPAGPAKLEALVDFCLQCHERIVIGEPPLAEHTDHNTPLPSPIASPAPRPELERETSYFSRPAAQDANAKTPTSSKDAKTPTNNAKLPTVNRTAAPAIVEAQNSLVHKAEAAVEKARRTAHGASSKSTSSPAARLSLKRDSRMGTGSESQGSTPRNRSAGSPSLHSDANHMSPRPPGSMEGAALFRRHSDQDKIIRMHPEAPPEEVRTSRPLMPARSITYHEPRLQRHVLMSPMLSSAASAAAKKRDSDEPSDYFGSAAGNSGYSTSSPSSPGSTVSLEGGEGAVLKTAIQAGKNPHVAPAVASAGPPGSNGGGQKRRIQILTVEDNVINRRVLAAFLSKMDVDFVETSNGLEGVKAFEAHPPHHFDLILMDLSMPVMDGITATAQIRKIEAERFRAAEQFRAATPGVSHGSNHAPASSSRLRHPVVGTPGGSRPAAQSRAKIFALTGRSSEDDKRKAFATGADGFIVKPLSFKVLSSLLKILARPE